MLTIKVMPSGKFVGATGDWTDKPRLAFASCSTGLSDFSRSNISFGFLAEELACLRLPAIFRSQDLPQLFRVAVEVLASYGTLHV